jgi:adenine/guanine phosphoribosyltransferase-like PRPP-binding protein
MIKLETIGALIAALVGSIAALFESPIALGVAIALALGVTVVRIRDTKRRNLRNNNESQPSPMREGRASVASR